MVWTEVEGCPCDLSDQSRSLQGRIRKNNIMWFTRCTGRAKGAEGRVRTIVQHGRGTALRDLIASRHLAPENPSRNPNQRPFSGGGRGCCSVASP